MRVLTPSPQFLTFVSDLERCHEGAGRRGYPNGGIAPFRLRTYFCDHWCVGVRLLGESKNARIIMVHRHYVSAAKRNIRIC
jgi:hypothetical protein